MTTNNSMPKLLEQYQQRMKVSAPVKAVTFKGVTKFQLTLDNLPLKARKEAVERILKARELRFKKVEVLSQASSI